MHAEALYAPVSTLCLLQFIRLLKYVRPVACRGDVVAEGGALPGEGGIPDGLHQSFSGFNAGLLGITLVVADPKPGYRYGCAKPGYRYGGTWTITLTNLT